MNTPLRRSIKRRGSRITTPPRLITLVDPPPIVNLGAAPDLTPDEDLHATPHGVGITCMIQVWIPGRDSNDLEVVAEDFGTYLLRAAEEATC
jgi:hypothetical protein